MLRSLAVAALLLLLLAFASVGEGVQHAAGSLAAAGVGHVGVAAAAAAANASDDDAPLLLGTPVLEAALGRIFLQADAAAVAQQLLRLHASLMALLARSGGAQAAELAFAPAREMCRLSLPFLAAAGVAAAAAVTQQEQGLDPQAQQQQQQQQRPAACNGLAGALRLADAQVDVLLAAAPVPHSFSIARRAFMGMLLTCSSARRLSAAEERLALGVMQKLYNLHRRGLAAKGLLAFLHISKAAGSAVCLLAERNKCTTQVFGENFGKGNCLVPRFDDIPRWVPRSQHSKYFPSSQRSPYVVHGMNRRTNYSCAERKALMRQKHWTFYANEFTLFPASDDSPGLGLCAEYAHLMVLRHPYARLVSHIAYLREQYAEKYSKKAGVFKRFTAAHWAAFAPAVVANYYVRTLLGEEVFHLPAEQLNTGHLRQAQEVMMGIEVLVDCANHDADRANLAMGLGWKHGLDSVHSKVASKSSRARKEDVLASERLSGLVQANLLDLELYDFFQLLGGLDGAMYLHLSAAAGADAADAPAAGGGGGPARAVAGVPAGAKRWPRCGWIGSGRRQEEEQQQEAAQVQVLQPQQLLAWSAQRVQPQPQAGAGAGAGSVAQAVSGDVSVTAADETSAGPATTTASNL